ncbi:MAG TPA: glutamyl-tRNA amidotransferase [Flavobacteriales bacterium]|nr:glutamyl-tRNA amidotransferase [Flavobacteriales bacterium]
MNLTETIQAQIVAAMKAKDQERLTALRAVKAELLLLSTSGNESSEEAEIKALQKLVKQRRESANVYKEQNREDLMKTELFEADVISEFLPEQMSDAELTEFVKNLIAKLGAEGMKDMGKVMGAASAQLAGKADGKTISGKVKELLGN